MTRTVNIYADSPTQLAEAVKPFLLLYNASGWARQETVQSGPGNYRVTIKSTEAR